MNITFSTSAKSERHVLTSANFVNDFVQPLTTFTAWNHQKNISAGMHIRFYSIHTLTRPFAMQPRTQMSGRLCCYWDMRDRYPATVNSKPHLLAVMRLFSIQRYRTSQMMGSFVVLIILLDSTLKVLTSITMRSSFIADGISVAKRLPCVIPIAPNDLTHNGAHSHTIDVDPFHYCKSR